MKKYHIVYRTHNLINGKEYTGKHSTDDLNDGYYGSGVGILNAIAKYGIENFAVEILSFHESEEAALAEEARIVDEEYVEREDTYNQTLGGEGSWHHCKGMATVKQNDNVFNVSIYDSRYLSGELKHRNCGEVTVKSIEGKIFNVTIDDPRYLSGELVHISKGMVNVINNGTRTKISITDQRFINGDVQHVCKHTISVKDKYGNGFRVDKNDPRYLSGELVGITTGMHYPNRQFNKKICPHCGKEGKGPNMTRYHFDNCKERKREPE